MRLAILTPEFPPIVGGIGDHTDHLAAALVRRGLFVSVITSAPAEERAAFEVVPAAERWDGPGIDAVVRATRAARPDAILWQYNPFSLGGKGLAPAAGRLARALAEIAPLVPLMHELWFPWGREGARGFAWAVAQRMQARAVLRASARAVVTTERRRDELARARVGRRIDAVPIGANIEPATDPSPSKEPGFVVAHLGSAGPGREMSVVFGALQTLRAQGIDARLVLAGKAGDVAVPATLADAVRLTGVLDRAGLSDELARAHAYVHPDLVGPAAGRRGSLMAALAHGLPVVAFRGPDHAPQLVDGENVVLVDADAHDCAAALKELASDPARRAALAAAARATYRRCFSWDVAGAALARALQETTR